MNLTKLIRSRQNGIHDFHENEIKFRGINSELKTLKVIIIKGRVIMINLIKKATMADCAKINPESLPAAIEFRPTSGSELMIADDRGNVSIINR